MENDSKLLHIWDDKERNTRAMLKSPRKITYIMPDIRAYEHEVNCCLNLTFNCQEMKNLQKLSTQTNVNGIII